ncbi:MAG: 3-hydroxyacyl-CoA dehydrogenase NAD-binding domain-containing protein [Candidatus Methanospirare jalkutatii]|nr:3-hydroxyacyl-CoA dehydrogenase NAD-binding domain-containing protein [Candidatus Methanospirare jalkutatii]
MSWEGLDIIFHEYPELRGKIEKLKEYIKNSKLKAGDLLDIQHASASTGIPEVELKQILERGVKLGIFTRVFRLYCEIRNGFVCEQEEPFDLPSPIFCDLCGEEHEFTENNMQEAFRINFVYSSNELKHIRDRMGLLGYLANKLSAEFSDRHFKDINFLIVLHFLKDLIVFLEACEKLGLEPSKTHLFYKPYLYPHREEIASHLKAKGYHVYPLENLEKVLDTLNKQDVNGKFIVIEDGGYIVPLLHKRFPKLLENTIGAVEQTTRGIRNDEQIGDLKIPVLNVAGSKIKNEIEPPHVADAVIRNLESLLMGEKLRGSKAAVLGYGTIGREIAKRLNSKGMKVTVYDLDELKRSRAREDEWVSEVVNESYNAVKNKLLVIGCSGETSIGREEILSLSHGTYLVSASSDQREIGLMELKALSSSKKTLRNENGIKIGTSYTIRGQNKVIHLIADGFPINFWYSESMPNQVSDLILSLIYVSAIELVKKDFGNGFQNIDKISEKYEIAKIYEQIYRG